MTKKEFTHITTGKLLYLDGAFGSNLMKAGMPAGVCPEQWILEHKEILVDLQKQYVQSGSNILYTPTFSGNRIKLREYGLENQLRSMTTGLVALSREAASLSTREKVYLAGDLTMTGELLAPMGRMELEELIDVYKEQILCLVDAGVDLLVVETMMSLAEARAALLAAKEVCDLPVMVTMTFERDGRTLYGTDAITAAVVLESLGAAAIGANCSAGPAQMTEIIANMAKVAKIPIIAKPNAGLPAVNSQGATYYDMDAITFADEMRLLVEAGATVLGGCCGTTPEYIRLIREKTEGILGKDHPGYRSGVRYLTSERMTVPFTLNQNFIIVGERINPTGKKKLQAELREGNLQTVIRFAEEQEACGARILDINMGMSGIDEEKMILQTLQEVSGVTNLPLSLDSSHIHVLEAALRQYPGRALINSISLESEKFEKLLPIAAKYGAMFILLPLSDKGLPENLEEKKQIIHKILDQALELGMCKEDIIVDGLVTTVGANKNAALETLETIRYCKELGLATICGLSNISFGMPERSFVNTAFLTLAIQAGLTMAIANPSQDLLVSCALATDLLLNKEESDIRYIEYANVVMEEKRSKEKREAEAAKQDIVKDPGVILSPERPSLSGKTSLPERTCLSGSENIRELLRNAVLKGNRKGIKDITAKALEAEEDASVLLNDILLPAINLVGDYFDQGKYFLPQLIASAEAMKLSIEVLEPQLLQKADSEDMPVVIIATVEGDIHDIGKNLVALMLKNYGFHVIDLGKDVPKETIVDAAKEHHAKIIALSALMTTTMQRMSEIIEYAKTEGVDAKVIIGGAVITQEYADEIGADGYSKDAANAVKLARRLMGLMQE